MISTNTRPVRVVCLVYPTDDHTHHCMLDRCNATVHGRVVLLATPDSGHYAMAQLLTACQLSTTTGTLRPASHLSSSQTAVHRADPTV